MNGLFDTNILVDHLSGLEPAREEIARHPAPAISIVTFMEILAGARDPAEEAEIRRFLRRFEVVPLTSDVAERAIRIRRRDRIRLPDAVIRASAEAGGRLLVTRNTRDFPADDPGIRVPYRH